MQKQTVIFEENPKWRIYKGKFSCQIGPLSRDRARSLYLIILWAIRNNNTERWIENISDRQLSEGLKSLHWLSVKDNLFLKGFIMLHIKCL